MKAHRRLLEEKGVGKEVLDRAKDLEYYDLDNLTEREDVISWFYLLDDDLEDFDVTESTRPTLAMLGLLKCKIETFDVDRKPNVLGEPRRHEILRKWIDGWCRTFVTHHPLKLYQPHFTRADINYAAVYAKLQYNEALLTYQELWQECLKADMIDVEATYHGDRSYPPPNLLIEKLLNPQDLVDFNKFDDETLKSLDWRVVDFEDAKAAEERKNFRYSIAVFAHNTRTIEAWTISLQDAQDSFPG
ncbi:uncharacterized protein LTR77_004376 [Saxophila tyrrhenica]|uniref:Uncharacterized protein n=1 Tax=Saxophila tyrrhenica TaxID=1690608 RepID=A0AAV9PFH9_9PEZI|nr:hypothetical protein LTR77_004376 [Saxophila tyrrhenica]